MRISPIAVDEFHKTRHPSLSLCNHLFNSLKMMSVLKENLNNNAADGMIIWKHAGSLTHLQLVSGDDSRFNQSAQKLKKMCNLAEEDI